MELKFILEAILFSAQKPMSLKEIRDVLAGAIEHAEGDEFVRGLKKTKEEELTAALEQLCREHEEANRSYRLACVAGSWQFVTQPNFVPWLKALVGHKARPPRPEASTTRSAIASSASWRAAARPGATARRGRSMPCTRCSAAGSTAGRPCVV